MLAPRHRNAAGHVRRTDSRPLAKLVTEQPDEGAAHDRNRQRHGGFPRRQRDVGAEPKYDELAGACQTEREGGPTAVLPPTQRGSARASAAPHGPPGPPGALPTYVLTWVKGPQHAPRTSERAMMIQNASGKRMSTAG